MLFRSVSKSPAATSWTSSSSAATPSGDPAPTPTQPVHSSSTIALYRRWWDLCEISLFVAEFIQPHEETEDTRVAWAGLQRFLDPARWSDPNQVPATPGETGGWTNEKWIDDEPGTDWTEVFPQ